MGFRSKRALRQRGLSCVQKEFVRKYQDASNRMRWMENDKVCLSLELQMVNC